MTVIDIKNKAPGIVGLLQQYPDTGRALGEFAHHLLFNHSPLRRQEREMIAVFVSLANNCEFCAMSHAAVFHHLHSEHPSMLQIFETMTAAAMKLEKGDMTPIEAKEHGLRLGPVDMWLLSIAMDVVENRVIKRPDGLSDVEIHAAALVASAFCMFNRYVKSLDTEHNVSEEWYFQSALRLADNGYRL